MPQSDQKIMNPSHVQGQGDFFAPMSEMVVNQWAVAEAVALVDARQREADERRHGSMRLDTATLSLFDDPTERVSRR